MRTRLCDMFEIEFPIFAFSHCRDVVAAVSRAGGFGVLGALAFSPAQLELELSWIDDHVGGKPYGVDVVMPASYAGKEQGATYDVVARSRPSKATLTRHGDVFQGTWQERDDSGGLRIELGTPDDGE